MIKLFISDLDGTLLGMDHYIKNEDIDSIKKMLKTGVHLAVASGRMDHEIKEVLKRLDVPGHRVSQNGAFVYDLDNTHIHSKTFKGDIAKQVMEAIAEEPMIKTVSTSDKTYTPEYSEWLDKLSEQLFHEVIVSPDMTSQFGTTIAPSKITLHGEEQDVINAYKRIKQTFGDNLDSFISHESCVDLMPKDINKGTGIRALLNQIDIQPDEMACIGDSFNDIAMFNLTPYSYAMSTAHPEVKEKANHVVDHVHEAIEDLEKKGLL